MRGTMNALLCERLGPPESLVLADLPIPEPGPGEALIRVRAAGLNFFDTLIIQGRYQVAPDLPFSPGGELCGEISALGPGVTGWREGQRVVAYLGFGAAREYVLARADTLAAAPDGLDDARAAGLSVTYGTTLHALVDRAAIRPGETLAVLGGRRRHRARRGGDRQGARRAGDRLRLVRREAGARARERRRRGAELCRGEPEGAPQGAHRRARLRRRLRSRRRRSRRAGAARHRLGGPLPGDRLRRGRHPEDPAQPPAAQGLRPARRVLGASSSAASPPATPPTWSVSSPGRSTGRSRRGSTRSIRSPRPPGRCSASRGARPRASSSSRRDGAGSDRQIHTPSRGIM